MRSLALDRFRALGVLSMIQGHTFTALLAPDALGSPPPRLYTLLHGLTAPMFLCGAGLAYGLSRTRLLSLTHQPASQRWQSVWPMVRRAAWLFALGFALQLPGWSLRRMAMDTEAFKITWAVGPLQLIASCLVTAELLRAVTGSLFRFRAGVALWLLSVLSVAPHAWAGRWSERLPVLFGTWLDGRLGSSFPALPWAAFFALGVLVSCTRALSSQPQRALRLTALGLLTAGVGYGMHAAAGAPRDAEVYWYAGLNYWLFRAGACLCVFGLLVFADRWTHAAQATQQGVVALFSRHSLVAYVVHLVVLYGSPLSRGLVHAVRGESLSYVALITAALLSVTLVCCALASRLRPFSRRVGYAGVAPAHRLGS